MHYMMMSEEAEIMDISPNSSPQNSRSESEGAEIDAIYGNKRYKSKQQRNWNSGRNWNFDNKWQNKGHYYSNCGNKDNFQKSKFENSRKGKFDNKSTNDKYSKEEVTMLLKVTIKHIMLQNLHKDVNEVKQLNPQPFLSQTNQYLHIG